MARLLRLLIAVLAAALSAASFAGDAAWADDDEVQTFIAEMQQRHAFDAASLRAEFARQGPDATVLRLIRPPTHPTQRSWQRYRGRFLTSRRISHGLDFWREHGATVARAAAEYGVPPQIIVAIIGVETEYGRNTGSFNVFNALATLAFRYPPRREFFREELEQFLLLARDNQLDLAATTGSFAGAIGIPQFMPGSQRRHAVDYDGDGRVDLAASAADAIGSVARFLANHGWLPDRPIAAPANGGERAPGEWVAAGIKPTLAAADLAAHDFVIDGLADADRVALVDLVTPDAATEYWWGFDNFYVITRYNRSSFYAMAVTQLAAAIVAERDAGFAGTPTAKAGLRAKRRRGG